MVWKPLLWTAHHLLTLLIGTSLALFLGACNRGSASEHSDGRIEFAPSKIALGAGIFIVIFMAYQSIEIFKHSQRNPLNFAIAAGPGLLALLILFGLPGTVVISSDNLQPVRWFWRNVRLKWGDIVEINTGKKNRTVTITGADGTKIVHSRQLADRSRMLLELKRHCGENLPPDFPREPLVSKS